MGRLVPLASRTSVSGLNDWPAHGACWDKGRASRGQRLVSSVDDRGRPTRIPQIDRMMVTTKATGTRHQRLRRHHDRSPAAKSTTTIPLNTPVLISVGNVGHVLQV